jgi:predicted phosphoribosyltransferase
VAPFEFPFDQRPAAAFRDRVDAGCQLAALLEPYRDADPVVVGLPRGGVPVAREVAAALGAPLDVIIVRKLGVPGHVELGMGAIGEDGVRVLTPSVVAMSGASARQIDEVAKREQLMVDERLVRYRTVRPRVPLDKRTVIVVDDGVATGGTARAALQIARAHGAARVVLAVPVAAPDTLDELRPLADEIVCCLTPPDFTAVGLWYSDFRPVSDDDVMALLEGATP